MPTSFSAPALSKEQTAFSVKNKDDDCWDVLSGSFDEFFDATEDLEEINPRKSILECNVNAYDLMSQLGKPSPGYDSGSDDLSDNALVSDVDARTGNRKSTSSKG